MLELCIGLPLTTVSRPTHDSLHIRPTCGTNSGRSRQRDQSNTGERLQHALDVGAQPLSGEGLGRELALLGHLGRLGDGETDDEAM